MCWVKATYFGTWPLGKKRRPSEICTGVSVPMGCRWRLKEFVAAFGFERVRLRHSEDAVGGADVPFVEVGELSGRGHICWVAFRRAVIGPGDDGGDFVIRERGVFLEFGDADVAVDVPGRH